jgi:hypothetical protein
MPPLKKPTKEDANIMLQLEMLLLMEPNYRAMYWFWRVFHPQNLTTAEEIRKTYPPTSEGILGSCRSPSKERSSERTIIL